MLNCIEQGQHANIIVLADHRPPPGRPAWLRVGAKASFLNGRNECDGVVSHVHDAIGKASVRITAPPFLAGIVSVVAFKHLIDADCPPDEDRHGEDEDATGGAA